MGIAVTCECGNEVGFAPHNETAPLVEQCDNCGRSYKLVIRQINNHLRSYRE